MTPRLATSVGIATLLSLAAIFFGVSLIRRTRDVARHYVSLERQLAEWAKKADESGIRSVPRQLAELANQRAVEEAKRQFAAAASRTASLAMQAVQARLETQDGLVAELQDAFEDEFGRELKRSDTRPPRYDAGPAPTITSDPFRYRERLALWSKAAAAAATFNELARLSQPDLDRYERELATQQQLLEDAQKACISISERIDALTSRIPETSPEDIRRKLQNCFLVSLVFGVSDAAAFLSALPLAVAVWLRTALIAGWFPVTRILAE